MKLTDKISSSSPFYTFEFFPPRSEQGFDNLVSRISRLSHLNPTAVSITWGAGGSTKDRSIELARLTQEVHGIDTILHLTCTNLEPGTVDDVLLIAQEHGIQNILALRGDPPRGQEYWMPTDPRFVHGIDLVKHIRASPQFSSHFCVGVAAYPDGHPDSQETTNEELDYLKAKIDAGADFIVTQLFYDVDQFLSWQAKVRAKGIHVPIIPGVMPLQTHASFKRMTKLCGSSIPPSLAQIINTISHDDQLVKDFGVKFAIDMVRRLINEGSVAGVHFCTLNLEKSVQRVLEGLQWVNEKAAPQNKLIVEAADAVATSPPTDPMHMVSASGAADTFAHDHLSETASIHDGGGPGEVNSAATWDEFPNGRFGDFKSPAYGENNQWGGSTLSSLETYWGEPTSIAYLTQMFLRYLYSELPTTPFSPAPLSSESIMILPHLERLTKRGLWTVGSQPAVDSALSTDPVVGWGPVNGYVFQKSFVEFFAEERDVEWVEKAAASAGGWVHFYAANYKGDCRTNVPEGSRNTVTWGVFPGQEITNSTIIEQESFLAWKDEAFSLWQDWASHYPPDSASRTILDSVIQKYWLVSIVHHDYRDPSALWTFLSFEK